MSRSLRPASPAAVFYSNALPEPVRKARGITTDSPAATRKVIAISKALRTAECRVLVVSMGRGAKRDGAYHRALCTRSNGVAFVIGPLWNVPVLSQLLSALWLMVIAWRFALRPAARARAQTVHLFYNQMSLYLPALLALRFRGAAIAVDIEDGPTTPGQVSYSRPGANAPSAFARCVNNGALLATTRLAEGTSIRPVMPCYGAVAPVTVPTRARAPDGALHVMFAGYISDETGLGQFTDMLQIMRRSGDAVYDRLVLEVSGQGPGVEALRAVAQGASPELRVHGRLDASGYAALLDRSHIGLSLKPVASAIAETTYPSKTIEIAESGLALVTTDISDVRAVFGNAAIYLDSNAGEALVAILRRAIAEPDWIAAQAKAGQSLVMERLSYAAVGAELRRFLFGGPQ